MKSQPQTFQQSLFLLLVRVQRYRHQEGGYSLVVSIAMLLILSTLLITAAVVSKIDSSSTSASARSNTGFFAAEAGLNIRAKLIRNKFEGYNRPTGTSPTDTDSDGEFWDSCVSGSGIGTLDFACTNYSFQGQNVVSYMREDPSNPSNIQVPADEDFGGLSAQEYKYTVESVARDAQNLPTAILSMNFKSRVVPLFQFAVFYENDADFSIPPNMTLNGRVHSNSDLYLNSANNTVTLRINGQVTTAGTLYRGNKTATANATQQCAGNVVIPTQTGTDQSLNCTGTTITPYLEATTTPSNISTWGNRIGISVPELQVPEPDLLKPVPGNLYWDSADLRVVLKLDGSSNPTGIEIRNADNSVNASLTNALRDSCPVASTTLRTAESTTETSLGTNNSTTLANFTTNDFIAVGTDIDSNVVRSINNGSTKSLTIRRQLGSSSASGATVRKAVVSTSNTFYNYREKDGVAGGNSGKYIRMLNVDMQALINCVHDRGLMGSKQLSDETDGGLVWFFSVDDSARGSSRTDNIDLGDDPDDNSDNASVIGNPYGIRLYNGSSLNPSISGAPAIKGLTIVSDQAVYIRGDYNNNASWKPASILADTINVLSNQWLLDDSNGRAYVGGLQNSEQINWDAPTRTPTGAVTINAAFLAGTEIPGGANGAATQLNNIDSGGVNNYPRFHENWNGINLNYRGSFVSLGQPRRVNAPFCGSRDATNCNIYSPPVRNWDYDTRFNDAANLPPLSPRAVYLQQELFERKFDRVSQNLDNLFVSAIPSIQPRFSL
ncbi:MAG: hypothetical protein HC934_07035 [Acaryochloridaceae cyanobacterium SU_2_1]|nr:hypothetical protein [Acaryochloridaceae cyanobacterium SU_2_1]